MVNYQRLLFGAVSWLLLACSGSPEEGIKSEPFVVVLGIAQDAGAPQIGCQRSCCTQFRQFGKKYQVASLGIVDPKSKSQYLVDATPDIGDQLHRLNQWSNRDKEGQSLVDGIFLTHAHIGHYAGLMYFGREALGAQMIPVFGMPRMRQFLEANGPWDQLVTLRNIELNYLSADSSIFLSNVLSITPFLVPHRDEYSETIGLKIKGPNKTLLFIPDIDKWGKWEKDIRQEVSRVDYALLDATFFDLDELPGRNMNEIPHPFIKETMGIFEALPDSTKSKITFIHLNHTNPALSDSSKAHHEILKNGYNVAFENMIIPL